MCDSDPLYQRALVEVVRESTHLFGCPVGGANQPQDWHGLPVVFDEVFTGLWRLGRFDSASFLGVHPDISVHAKLLTGGLVPLCATLASESVYNAFAGDDKSDALLHGHSYTAHAVGCQVALESLEQMQGMGQRHGWDWAKTNGRVDKQKGVDPRFSLAWSVWSNDFVENLSRQTTRVGGVWALGSVLSISIRGHDRVGYSSTAATRLQLRLKEGYGSWTVHSRTLGNVLYLMASQTTGKDAISALQDLILEVI